MNAVGKDDKLDMALKGAYAANKYSVTATLAQSGKVRRRSAPALQGCGARECGLEPGVLAPAGRGWAAGAAASQMPRDGAAAGRPRPRQLSRTASKHTRQLAGVAPSHLPAQLAVAQRWRHTLRLPSMHRACSGRRQPAMPAARTVRPSSAPAGAPTRRARRLPASPVPLPLQLAVAVGYKELVPGLTLGLTGTVPDTDSGARGRGPHPAPCPCTAWGSACSNSRMAAAAGKAVQACCS